MGDARQDLLKTIGYSDKAVTWITTDHHFGRKEGYNVEANEKGACGDQLWLFLKVENGIIREASFEHVGCMGLQASAAGLTTMIEGMPEDEAFKIDVPALVSYIGGIPDQKMDCAELACNTLRKALTAA